MNEDNNRQGFEGSLWRKVLGKIPLREGKNTLDDFRRQEEARVKAQADRILSVGNMQITHVAPEVTVEDQGVQFGTDLFFNRCLWAKRNAVVYRKLLSFADSENSFYIVGESGCGKTVFAKTFAFYVQRKAATEALFDASYVKFMNFSKLMEALSKDDWAYKNYILDEMRKAKHLFIDDLGTEKYSEYTESILCSILDSRLHKEYGGVKLKTYFTSNAKIEALPYEERVKRRIRDMAVEIAVGASLRPDDRRGNLLMGNPTHS